MTTDTPRTDACPHCGAKRNFHSIIYWKCHSQKNQRSVLCKEREARLKAEAELAELWSRFDRQMQAEQEAQNLKAICDEQQANLKFWGEEIEELRLEVIAAQESEAVWKTEADKADQRRLEAEAKVERLKEQYESAAESVARMHEAAVGEIRGPIISVIEDIKAVRERAVKAEAEAEMLRSTMRSFIDFMDENLGTTADWPMEAAFDDEETCQRHCDHLNAMKRLVKPEDIN